MFAVSMLLGAGTFGLYYPTVPTGKLNTCRVVRSATSCDSRYYRVLFATSLNDSSTREVLATPSKCLLTDLLSELASAERLDVDRNYHVRGSNKGR